MLMNMKLSMKIGLVFAVLLLMDTSSFLTVSRSISNIQSDAATINLSGVQRMNAERMLRLAQHIPRGDPEIKEELLRTMNTFAENLEMLQHGNSYIQSPQPHSDAWQHLTGRVVPNWQIENDLLTALMNTSDAKESMRLLALIKQQYEIWSADINQFVTIVQEHSTAKVRRVKQTELATVLINLLVVAAAMLAVIHLITRPISRITGKMNRLADGHYKLEPLIVNREDEIGLLAKSFNSMLQNIQIRKDVIATGEMQRRLLPREFVQEGLKVSVIYQPSQFVSGDFVDYIWDDERKRLYGFVIDIMGHGMTSAVQFGAIRVLLRQSCHEEEPIKDRLARVNREAAQYFSEESFAAVMCFELDRDGCLTYAGGGINHFIIHRQGRAEFVKSPGSLLGLFEQAEYEQQSIQLEPGTGCVFASDGLLEIIPHPGDEAGDFDQYADSLRQLAARTATRDDVSAICVYWR